MLYVYCHKDKYSGKQMISWTRRLLNDGLDKDGEEKEEEEDDGEEKEEDYLTYLLWILRNF